MPNDDKNNPSQKSKEELLDHMLEDERGEFSETPIGTLWTPKNLTMRFAYRFIPTLTMMMVIKYKFWNDNKDSRPGRQDLFYFLSHLQMLKDAKVWI